MWPNLQFLADLVTFTKEILNGKLIDSLDIILAWKAHLYFRISITVEEFTQVFSCFWDSKLNISSPAEVFLGKVDLKICSEFTGEHPCWSVISIKLLCRCIKTKLRHGCSPIDLLHIFRAPLPKNTSRGLLVIEAAYIFEKYFHAIFVWSFLLHYFVLKSLFYFIDMVSQSLCKCVHIQNLHDPYSLRMWEIPIWKTPNTKYYKDKDFSNCLDIRLEILSGTLINAN